MESLKNEDGSTAVEQAVMLALIRVVCITAINTFSYVSTEVGNVGSERHRTALAQHRP